MTLTFLLMSAFSVWVGMLGAYFLGKLVGVPGYVVGFIGGFYVGYLVAWIDKGKSERDAG